MSDPAGARRAHAEQVQARILAVATEHLRHYGYDRTSLAQIGAALGLTRGAVLYHFRSKADLLGALLTPFTAGLDQALTELETRRTGPRPAQVIDTVLDLLVANRLATELLTRDIASRHALDLDAWSTTSAARLVALLSPDSATDPAAAARGYAALGALIRPLVSLPDPLPEPARPAIRRAALNALRPPRGHHQT
ncbi:helix-turn-helix domain-containing protein [Intrasporangium sp.]|uniref:TetR/AcrR family transcriptional regulator n=1 Tax=Intrasporangium sp. TaxID=1925024 RepID=UPI003221CB87